MRECTWEKAKARRSKREPDPPSKRKFHTAEKRRRWKKKP
jgi:hypothetical protein